MILPAAPELKRPPLRWLGGKFRLAPKIIEHFPPHRIYVDAYGGGGSVLWCKPRAYNEIWNDLDGDLVNLFRVLRGPRSGELLRQLYLTPYAVEEYRLALEPTLDPVERARRLVVRSHMAHGTGGARIDRPTGFRIDGVTGTTNVAGEWAELPAELAPLIERLRGVSLQNKPALELIRAYDTPKALIYLDPPYVPDTRSNRTKSAESYHAYRHELTIEDHCELLTAIRESSAMIILSGYPHPLYDEALRGWRRIEMAARAHRNSPRVEVLWINEACASQARQLSLLEARA